MFQFFRKLFAYFGASANAKFDEKSDPKIQIEQALQEAKKRHQQLSQQAAAVIGNQRQLEMKLTRAQDDVARMQASARQALVMADQARAAGDEVKAAEYEQTATTFATQLVASEQGYEDLKALHEQSVAAAQSAKAAVEQNAMMLQQKVAERSKLLTQLEAAKMQEKVAESLQTMSGIANTSVPSLEDVREKIEGRYAKAMGSAELAASSVEGRMMEVQKASLDAGASARLAQIRASMNPETAAPDATPPLSTPQKQAEGPSASSA